MAKNELFFETTDLNLAEGGGLTSQNPNSHTKHFCPLSEGTRFIISRTEIGVCIFDRIFNRIFSRIFDRILKHKWRIFVRIFPYFRPFFPY